MQAQEEMVFAISLPAYTQATTVFNAVEKFYEEKEIPMQNILQCATGGAAPMVGKHRGFIALMKKKIPGLIVTHCIIRRQHLAARNLNAELHNSLHIVIKCINRIKARSLNDRLFRALCHDNEEDFESLLLSDTYSSTMAFERYLYHSLLLPSRFSDRFPLRHRLSIGRSCETTKK